MSKLPEPFRTNWINALRSGEYEQATGELVDVTKENCYCAIGLAGHLAGISDEEMRCSIAINQYMTGANVMPELIVPKLDNAGRSPIGKIQRRIINLNDMEGKSFAEIADYIQQNL